MSDFKLHIIEDRVSNFDSSLMQWLEEGAEYNRGIPFMVVKRNPHLFTPEFATKLAERPQGETLPFDVGTGEIDNYLLKTFSEMSEEQLDNYFSSFTIFFLDQSNSIGNYRSKLLSDVLLKKTNRFQDKFIKEIFLKFDSSPNNISGSTLEHLLEFISTQNGEINDEYIVKNIAKYGVLFESIKRDLLQNISKKFAKNEKIKSAVTDELRESLEKQLSQLKNQPITSKSLNHIFGSLKAFGIDDVVKHPNIFPKSIQSLFETFGTSSFSEVCDLLIENKEFAQFLFSTPDKPALLTSKDLLTLSNLHFTLVEAEELKRANIDLSILNDEESFRRAFDILARVDTVWQDEQNIAIPFKSGAEVFGYQKMFAYLFRKKNNHEVKKLDFDSAISRHDCLHAFHKIIEIYNASQLSADKFYGQILHQVMFDNSEYQSGFAHHYFNEIANTLNLDFKKTLFLAKEFSEIERLQELATDFSSPNLIFENWNNLKRYSNLSQILVKTKTLKSIRAIDNLALKTYVTYLAFHKDSKVDMRAAFELALHPDKFLARYSSHTPEHVHNSNNPSNYTRIPNLDLSARDLVIALVEGKMDELAVFPSMEVHYSIVNDNFAQDMRQLIKRALGSRTEPESGLAINNKRLFSELKSILQKQKLSLQAYLNGEEIPIDNKQQVEEEISKAIYNQTYGIPRSKLQIEEFVVKIGRKSDPEMVLAGNDTAGCMPFGDGKSIVYTFNPNTNQLILQRVRQSDKKHRTFAQSVLTKDLDIQIKIPDILSELQGGEAHLAEVLPESILTNQTPFIACDNVEPAPRYRAETLMRIATILYQDFFKEYVNYYRELLVVNNSSVVIGKGTNDPFTSLENATNTFAPQAPVSYSDKTGSEVRILNLRHQMNAGILFDKTIVTPESIPQASVKILSGIVPLTFEHTLQVAYIEGKAYADNKSLMEYLFNMGNGLIAKDINNAAKGRPNLSLGYRDETGKMRGYLFAYEGVLNDDDVNGLEQGRAYFSKPAIYISDLATDKGGSLAWARLVKGFNQLYSKHYLEKGTMMPIFLQARETTSFKFIQRELEKLSEGLGIEFDLIELPTKQRGKDTMHPVIICPKKQILYGSSQ